MNIPSFNFKSSVSDLIQQKLESAKSLLEKRVYQRKGKNVPSPEIEPSGFKPEISTKKYLSISEYRSANDNLNEAKKILEDAKGYMQNISDKIDKTVNELSNIDPTISGSPIDDSIGYSEALDDDGNYWVGTGDGVQKYNGTYWLKYTADDGLVNNKVNKVFKDSNGNMWFGTNGGVSKYNVTTEEWTNYTTSNGLAYSNIVNDIYQDSNGNYWFATEGGVDKFDGSTFTANYDNTNDSGQAYELPSDAINAVTEDSSGNMWFATDQGAAEFNPNTETTLQVYDTSGPANFKLINNIVHDVLQDSEGDMWFATEGGITLFDSGAKRDIVTGNGLPSNTVFSLSEAIQIKDTDSYAVGPSGDGWDVSNVKKYMWAATDSGIGQYWWSYTDGEWKKNNTVWTSHTTSSTDLASDYNYSVYNYIHSVYPDASDQLRMITEDGDISFDSSKWNESALIFGTKTGITKFDNTTFDRLPDNAPENLTSLLNSISEDINSLKELEDTVNTVNLSKFNLNIPDSFNLDDLQINNPVDLNDTTLTDLEKEQGINTLIGNYAAAKNVINAKLETIERYLNITNNYLLKNTENLNLTKYGVDNINNINHANAVMETLKSQIKENIKGIDYYNPENELYSNLISVNKPVFDNKF